MSTQIRIQKVKHSKANTLDFNDIPLGRTFTDHMFLCAFENNAWQQPEIIPMGPLPTHPAAMALHYGQAIFEGMKATVNLEGRPMLFRPEQNAKRLNFSARRLGMPEFPETLFVEALKALVDLDRNWIPPQQGSALYLRPFAFFSKSLVW